MSTSLGRPQHKQRAVFVESFWWFLHRTTAFGVDVNDDDAEVLFSAVLAHCPELSVLHCPTNMVSLQDFLKNCLDFLYFFFTIYELTHLLQFCFVFVFVLFLFCTLSFFNFTGRHCYDGVSLPRSLVRHSHTTTCKIFPITITITITTVPLCFSGHFAARAAPEYEQHDRVRSAAGAVRLGAAASRKIVSW